MAKKKSKKKQQDSYVRIIGILVVLAALAAAVTFFIQSRMPSKKYEDLAAYFSIDADDTIGLSVDGTIVKNGARLIDGAVYVSYDAAEAYLNHRFYRDETEGLLCVTTPTVFKTFSLAELEASGDIREVDDVRYLSLAFVEAWTDLTADFITESDDATGNEKLRYLTVTTDFHYETAVADDGAKLRTRPTTKANILKDATAGEVMRVLDRDDTGEGWQAVVSGDGLSGYMRLEDLTEGETVGSNHVSIIGDYTSLSLGKPVNMVFYQSDNPLMNVTLKDKLDRGVSGINVVAPTWFFLKAPGQVISNCDEDFTALCHERGYQVWALLNDIDGAALDRSDVYAILKTTSSRQAIIRTMIDTVLAMNIDGINVDLEKISEECAPAYLEFLRELSVECRNNGLYLSVDTYVPMNHSLYLNRAEQAVIADYVVIMCYDEHFAGSEEAGSVASLGFMETGIERSLREVPAEKLVAAIPFYTRLWKTEGNGNVSSRLMSMDEAQAYISANGMTVFWDESVGQHLAERTTSTALEQIWVEDARSIGEKMKLIQAHDLAGVAAWNLGNETSDVWSVISSYLS